MVSVLFSNVVYSFLAVCESALLGKPEYYGLPKWLIAPLVITTGLFLLVITNDCHYLVFQFPQDAMEHTDADFSYAPGYYLVLIWEILCAVYAVVIMILKCRIPGERRVRMLPFVPIAVSVLYAIIFINRIPYLSVLTKDVTIFQCLFFMLSFECCIRCDLIQSNSDYLHFFTESKLPLLITDREYHIHMKSNTMVVPEYEEMKRSEVCTVKLSDKYQLLQFEIPGGRVLWKEDISAIERAMEKLRALNDSLEELYQMKAEEVRTQRKKEQLREANRIYGQMQKQTEKQLFSMELLLKELSHNENADRDYEIIWKLSVIGAYIKRRNNLFFISETQNLIQSRELDYCFQESLRALKLKGISVSYQFLVEGQLSFSNMVTLYDAFQYIIEIVMCHLNRLDLVIHDGGERVYLQMSLLLCQDVTIKLPDNFEIERESDHTYDILCQVEKERLYGIL